MDKISSILPSNARIKSVDLTGSGTARPGAPSFGRAVGRTSSEDRVSFSDPKAGADSLASGYNPKEARHAKMAEEMSRKFFDTRLKPVEESSVEDDVDVTADLPSRAVQLPALDREIVNATTSDVAPEREKLDVYA